MPDITIDELRVATPCQSAVWDTSDDERARLCTTCNKNVYNVSLMTLAEAGNLIREKEGKLCISLYKSFKGKTLTDDAPKGFRFFRKKYLIARAKAIAFALAIWGFITGTITSCHNFVAGPPNIPYLDFHADINGKQMDSFGQGINELALNEILIQTVDSNVWIFLDSTERAPGTYENHHGIFPAGGYKDPSKSGSYIWYTGELKITAIDNTHATGTFWFNASDSTIRDTAKITNGSFDVSINYGKIAH